VHDGDKTGQVARVAVCIPAACVDNVHGLVEVIACVEQGHNHDGMVGHDVNDTVKLVIPVFVVNTLPGHVPGLVKCHPFTHILDQHLDQGAYSFFTDDFQPCVNQMVDVLGDECLGFHGGPHHGSEDALAIVADRAGCLGELCRELRLSRAEHGPAINEDLSANLLGNRLAVCLDTAAIRCFDAILQVEEGSVLGGYASASPPKGGLLLDDVVKPGLANLLGGDVLGDAMLHEGLDEGEGAGDVVVSEDGWSLAEAGEMSVDVVTDGAKLSGDGSVRPALERPTKINADELAEHASVHARQVVGGYVGIG